MKLRFLLLIFIPSLCLAQRDFRPGYIIIQPGDTLFGKIDYRGDKRMGTTCDFQTETGGIRTFSPYNIFGFRFIDGKYYVSRNVKNEGKLFLEYLINAKLNIYYLRDITGDRYFIEKEGNQLVELPYKEEYVIIDGKEYKSTTTQHKEILKFFTQETPELEAKIKTIKKPHHKNLISFAEQYHNIVCEDEKCVIYEKKLPPVKVNFELAGGITRYKDLDVNNTNYKSWGLLANVWLPRENEKLFFKTGVVKTKGIYTEIIYDRFSPNNYKEKEYSFEALKIPLRLEYIYPQSGFLGFRANIGANFNIINNAFEPKFITYAFSCGLNFRVLNNVHIMTMYDADILGLVIAGWKFRVFSHSFLTGLYFAF